MTITAALRAHLLADAAIATIVGPRVYALRLPQKLPAPLRGAVVLTRISQLPFSHLRGSGSLARPRYQVDCWATTNDDATALGILCRQRLAGYAGTWSDDESPETHVRVVILPEEERDVFEEDIQGGLCRHSADYFLFHGTANNTV